jgi:hypothetical protein
VAETQTSLSNPFAQQPSAIDTQIDNPFEALNAEQGAAADAMETQPPVDAPAAPPTNPFMAIAEEGVQDETPMGEFQTMEGEMLPVNTAEQGNIASAGEQLSEAFTRFRNAWTSTPKESQELLKKSGKFDDVKIGKDETIMVKRKGDKGYTKFDRDGLQVLGDLLDLTRIGAEAGLDTGMTAIGTALSIPTTGGAAAPALSGASAMATLNIADQVAENLIGVERDPERSRTAESAIAFAAGATFNMLGASIGRRLARNKAARDAAVSAVDKINSKIADAKEMIGIVEKTGMKLDPSTGEMFLTPGQATQGTMPELTMIEKEFSKLPEYRNFVEQQGEVLKGAYEGMIERVARENGVTNIPKDFQLSYKQMGEFFGKEIGRFREMAKEGLKLKQPAPQTFQKMMDMSELFQVTGKEQMQLVQETYPALTDSQAKIVVSTFNKLKGKFKNGAMDISDVDQMYTMLRTQIDNSANSAAGKPVADALIPIKNALRDDYAEMIGKVVPPDQKQAYGNFMKRYADFKSGEDELRNLLKTSALSRKALISKLFEGTNSLSLAKSVKTVMDENDPAFFKQLAGEYFMKLKNDSVDPDNIGKVNWRTMARKFGANEKTGLGKEMQEMLLDGAGLKREEFNALMNIGQMIQNTSFKFAVEKPPEKLGWAKTLWNLVMTRGAAQSSAGATILGSMAFKDGTPFMTYMKDGGFEKFVKVFPNYSPGKIANARAFVDNWTPSPVKTGAKVGGQMLRTSTRKDLEGTSN